MQPAAGRAGAAGGAQPGGHRAGTRAAGIVVCVYVCVACIYDICMKYVYINRAGTRAAGASPSAQHPAHMHPHPPPPSTHTSTQAHPLQAISNPLSLSTTGPRVDPRGRRGGPRGRPGGATAPVWRRGRRGPVGPGVCAAAVAARRGQLAAHADAGVCALDGCWMCVCWGMDGWEKLVFVRARILEGEPLRSGFLPSFLLFLPPIHLFSFSSFHSCIQLNILLPI